MAKLYFRHGPVSSAKTLNLLAARHNYLTQGKKVITVKPAADTRYGERTIGSRALLTAEADVVLEAGKTVPFTVELDGVSCVLVDEVQFLHPSYIDHFRTIANAGVPVICYGLRTDHQRRLFPASARLFELADSIEEIKTTCARCNRKAIFNEKFAGDKGLQVEVGGDEMYRPVCATCWIS